MGICKSTEAEVGFTIEDKHFSLNRCELVKGMEWCFCFCLRFRHTKSLKIFDLSTFTAVQAVCGYMTWCCCCACHFSHQCFSPPKLHSLSLNTLGKHFTPYISPVYNNFMQFLSLMVHLIAAMAVLLASTLHCC